MAEVDVPGFDCRPKFIGIGAQRAGTTWLYECLKEHPEIFMPSKKELHFFDLNYELGFENYLKEYFPSSELQGKHTWGEITPNYYQSSGALERLAKDLPDAKILYVLREPISRLESQYQLYLQSHYEGLSLDEAMSKFPNLIDLSMQGKHLLRLYELYDRKQVQVLFYDELCSNPGKFITKVYRFLGVDDTFTPVYLKRTVNRVVFPRIQKILSVLKLSWLIAVIKKTPFSEYIKQLAKKTQGRGRNARLKELKEVYREDISILEAELSVDLGGWK